jgi:DNA-binding transcriptional LysR family regulator
MIEGRHMAAFVALAEERHFTHAARKLGISQPRLSLLLQRLEDLAGAQLFERRPHVRLTSEGEAALPHFEAALRRLQAGVDLLERRRQGLEGTLRLGFPTWVLASGIPDLLVEFRRTYPRVSVDLFDFGTTAQIDQLRAGTLSMGFIHAAAVTGQDLTCERLFDDPWRVVVPSGHPTAAAKHIRLRDLEGEPFVSFPEDLAPHLTEQLKLIYRRERVMPCVAHRAREWLAIVGLVRAGAGWALVPASIEKLYSTGLSYRPLQHDRMVTTVCACTAARPDPVTLLFRDSVLAWADTLRLRGSLA